MERNNENKIISEVTTSEYKYGFVSNFDSDTIDEGLSENVIKTISNKKNEPSWMLEKDSKPMRYSKLCRNQDGQI